MNALKQFGVAEGPLKNVLMVARKRCGESNSKIVLNAWWALVETSPGVFHTHWFNTRRVWVDREMDSYWVGERIKLHSQKKATTVDDWEDQASGKGYTVVEDVEYWPIQCTPHAAVCMEEVTAV